ncbi:unnamed protein product [Meloidogyne enterolobii]|uniref:Uncharacterized protein n=1 Tax=Meloidogyne enterolobii TaxID=390850 RepID=A0ACB1AGB7_MELEN
MFLFGILFVVMNAGIFVWLNNVLGKYTFFPECFCILIYSGKQVLSIFLMFFVFRNKYIFVFSLKHVCFEVVLKTLKATCFANLRT